MSPAEPAGDAPSVKPTLDLRDPILAGIMAWLIPGAGHWYQGRRTKAVLFFITIMGSFTYGLWLGGGRVVYAAWGPTPEDKRLPYFCQLGVGVAALPALWQAQRFGNSSFVDDVNRRRQLGTRTFGDQFMAPPIVILKPNNEVDYSELDDLNFKYHRYFELGTVYTMIAGLLNLLVIFDACGGPALGIGANRMNSSDQDRAGVAKPPPGA